MSETALIRKLFKKYDLSRPLGIVDRRKVLAAKRRTLSLILRMKQQGGFFMGFSLSLYSRMKGAGMSVTPAAGIRAAAALSAAAVIAIAAVPALIAGHYIYRDFIPPYGTITAQAGDIKITRDGVDTAPLLRGDIKKGDTIVTGGDSGILFQYGSGIVVRILSESAVVIAGYGEDNIFLLNEGTLLSRVPRGGDHGRFEIITPGGKVEVTGTEFGVCYYDEETRVFVSRGAVSVTDKPSGVKYDLTGGFATLLNAEAVVEEISSEEEKLMDDFAEFRFIESVDTLSDEELRKINEGFDGRGYRPPREDDTGRTLSLEDLEKIYGRLDRIILYSGRIIKGVIISRGERYRVLTPQGEIALDSKQIRDSHTVK